MSEYTLAKRYAKALLDVADERDSVREIEEEMVQLKSLYEEDEYLGQVLENPLIDRQEKQDIVKDTLSDYFGEEVMNLLNLMIEKGRAEIIPHVTDAYDRLADDRFGVVRVRACSARPVSDAVQAELQEQLERLLDGQKVDLTCEEDPELLAGIKIRIGDHVLDASLEGRIKDLEESLVQQQSL
jgi:F-type H+-transporting ATPase subunit delta